MDMDDSLLHLKDFWWTFILPAICLFGLFTNLINVLVFLKLKSKNPIYKLMLTNSFSNFIYSFICFFVFMMRCGRYCSLQHLYWVKLYEKYLFYYFTSVLGFFNILVEIVIAIQRYFIVANKNFTKRVKTRTIILGLFLISLVVYTPNIFYRRIVLIQNQPSTVNNQTLYYMIKNANDNATTRIFLMVISAVRGLLIFFLLLIINLLLLHRFSEQVNKNKKHKKSMKLPKKVANNNNNEGTSAELNKSVKRIKFKKGESLNENDYKAKKNMTRMVIWMSISFFIGNLLNSLSFYILYTFQDASDAQKSTVFTAFFVLVSNSLVFTSHGINIIFYYLFNKNYRNIIKASKFFQRFK